MFPILQCILILSTASTITHPIISLPTPASPSALLPVPMPLPPPLHPTLPSSPGVVCSASPELLQTLHSPPQLVPSDDTYCSSSTTCRIHTRERKTTTPNLYKVCTHHCLKHFLAAMVKKQLELYINL